MIDQIGRNHTGSKAVDHSKCHDEEATHTVRLSRGSRKHSCQMTACHDLPSLCRGRSRITSPLLELRLTEAFIGRWKVPPEGSPPDETLPQPVRLTTSSCDQTRRAVTLLYLVPALTETPKLAFGPSTSDDLRICKRRRTQPADLARTASLPRRKPGDSSSPKFSSTYTKLLPSLLHNPAGGPIPRSTADSRKVSDRPGWS